MINDIIQQAIQTEVDSKIEKYISKYNKLEKDYLKLQESYEKIKSENSKLFLDERKLNIIEVLSSKININSIEDSLLDNLDYTPDSISFDGMDSNRIPQWFKILVKYYHYKDEIFNFFDIFNIEYPIWAKDIVLPNNYNKEQLKLCLENTGQMYVCNGQIYSGNMGFYYTYHQKYQFKLEEVFKNESYVEIPFQLLLKNKLLIEDDELFELLIENIYNNRSHVSYFMKIVEYQDVPVDKVIRLLSPDKNNSINYKSIVKKYPLILKDSLVGNSLKNGISEYSGSELYLLKFNKDIQRGYLLNRKKDDNDFVGLIDKSTEFTSAEKAELIKQCYINKTQ